MIWSVEKASECIEKAKGLRYFLSAGCEIPADTPDEVYFAFVKAAHDSKTAK
jgi:uroporphyrinogen-III decarboxylase